MRTSSRHLAGVVLTLAVVAGACAKPNYIIATPRAVDPATWPATRLSSHVVLVSIDGLRPDAITAESAPTLTRLMREGSFTLAATTILPSKTLPSHTSMLTGQPPEAHGVRWNTVVTADADLIEVPSVFGVARARGYQTAAFYSKPKFQPLQQPEALDYSQAPGGWFGGWKSDRTTDDVERYLATARPNLLFVHLADPDRAGHSTGWMSDDYMLAVTSADLAVSRIATAAAAAFGSRGYTLIVTADHGGHGLDHGSDDPRDVTIPWIAWGAGVRPGPIASPVRTMDTAATALFLLGVDEPPAWAGQPVISAFVTAPVTAPSGG